MSKLIQSVFFEENVNFGNLVQSWFTAKGFEVKNFNSEMEDAFDLFDSAVIFHENHNFDKNIEELRSLLETYSVATHKIDLSGTMNVAITNFDLFLDLNKSKNLLVIGSDTLVAHPKMDVFIEKWGTR
jgi:hypothetical protein